MARSPEKKEGGNLVSPHSSQSELERQIEEQIGPLVGKSQREQILSRLVRITQSEKFQGPVAHPRHLREYEEILPGSAERIFQMAEKSLDHLQEMQAESLRAEIEERKSGRILGFAALIALISAALISGYMGLQSLSIAFLGAGVLGAVGAIIQGKNDKKNSDDAET